MSDIKLTQDVNGSWDLSIADGDLEAENGLDTSIWLSLFTDQRAPADYIAKPEERRGWLGDLASLVEERKIGSLLWLADQRRLNQTTLNEIINYARDALQWMMDDGICKNVKVEGTIVPTQGITLTITITSYDGSSYNRFVDLWRMTGD